MANKGEKMTDRWRRCWEAAPDIYVLLKESRTMESAREKMIRYLEALEWSYRHDYNQIPEWHYILLKEGVRNLKNIISPRNERLSKSSPLRYLWQAAKNGDSRVEEAFIDEIEHLFLAIKGNTSVYPSHFLESTKVPDFDKYKGREAALKRSDFLDLLAGFMQKYISRYPSGLEPEIVGKRKENRKRILKALKASEQDWDNWKWQFQNVLMTEDSLKVIKQVIRLTDEQEKAIRLAIRHKIPFGVTPYYLHLMDIEPGNEDFAVRSQVFPSLQYVKNITASKKNRELGFDFMREHETSPIKHITRRYPKVLILKPYDSCPQICTYCQRNWEITAPFESPMKLSQESIDLAVKWIADHSHIMDILVTGGDPLILNDTFIDRLLKKLAEIPHLLSIRIATRTPVTVPQRITEKLCDIFAKYISEGKRILYLVTHYEHPYEITPESAGAIRRIRKRGISAYNQQVFTFATSFRFESVALRIALKKIGVDPYYTFNMKGKSEMSEYAVPIARILQERKEEARLLPGIYRTDESVFNVPFRGKNHLRAWQDHTLISVLPDGRRVYSFQPWEKNISKVNPYLYTDVTIRGYLEKLKQAGEDVEAYRSIWYYY